MPRPPRLSLKHHGYAPIACHSPTTDTPPHLSPTLQTRPAPPRPAPPRHPSLKLWRRAPCRLSLTLWRRAPCRCPAASAPARSPCRSASRRVSAVRWSRPSCRRAERSRRARCTAARPSARLGRGSSWTTESGDAERTRVTVDALRGTCGYATRRGDTSHSRHTTRRYESRSTHDVEIRAMVDTRRGDTSHGRHTTRRYESRSTHDAEIRVTVDTRHGDTSHGRHTTQRYAPQSTDDADMYMWQSAIAGRVPADTRRSDRTPYVLTNAALPTDREFDERRNSLGGLTPANFQLRKPFPTRGGTRTTGGARSSIISPQILIEHRARLSPYSPLPPSPRHSPSAAAPGRRSSGARWRPPRARRGWARVCSSRCRCPRRRWRAPSGWWARTTPARCAGCRQAASWGPGRRPRGTAGGRAGCGRKGGEGWREGWGGRVAGKRAAEEDREGWGERRGEGDGGRVSEAAEGGRKGMRARGTAAEGGGVKGNGWRAGGKSRQVRGTASREREASQHVAVRGRAGRWGERPGDYSDGRATRERTLQRSRPLFHRNRLIKRIKLTTRINQPLRIATTLNQT